MIPDLARRRAVARALAEQIIKEDSMAGKSDTTTPFCPIDGEGKIMLRLTLDQECATCRVQFNAMIADQEFQIALHIATQEVINRFAPKYRARS